MVKKEKKLNPSVVVLMQQRDELLGETVKPIKRMANATAEDEECITDEDLEIWKCKIRTTYKSQFVCEFTDYPYRILTHLAIKLYGYIKHNKLKFHDDEFTLSITDVMDALSIQRTAAYDALADMLKHKILFKTSYKEVFYINVLMVFKGDLGKLLRTKLDKEKKAQL